MTGDNQTQKGVATSTADLLKPKTKLRIGCWNVRTMYQTGKLAQIVNEAENYGIDILGISEARWTGSGKRRLTSGHTLLYSGRQDHLHQEGVAIIMKKEATKSLLEWNPVSERIMVARFDSNSQNLPSSHAMHQLKTQRTRKRKGSTTSCRRQQKASQAMTCCLS